MEAMCERLGRYVTVISIETGKAYSVCRHYIALHGVRGHLLHTYGFAEIS